MRMSEHGRNLLTQWEGFKTKPYLDVGGKQTIGVGHLLTDAELNSGSLEIQGVRVPWGPGLTQSQVGELLRQDLTRFEEAVERLVSVPLTQNQFDALVSFTFNLGETNLAESTLLKRVNAGDFEAVPTELIRWTKVAGKPIEGLIRRREHEIDLWKSGAAAQPLPPTPPQPAPTPPTPTAPDPAPSLGHATTPSIYTIAPGDTLASVAQRFGVTVAELANANDIINPADFAPPRIVRIPSSAAARSSFKGELSRRDTAKNAAEHVRRQAKVLRQVKSPTTVPGVDHREQIEHILAVQQFGRDLDMEIKADGVAGPLTYGLTLTLQLGMIDGPYLDAPLRPDAAPGPATTAMLGFSRDNNFRCSKNFRWTEFDTKNPDRVVSKYNPVLMIDRNLIILAQRIRDHLGFGFSPISAYRDPEWNEVVKGSLKSQHMAGKAIDIDSERLRLTESVVRHLGAKGVGIVGATGFVSHVDTRAASAKWFY